MIKIPIKSSYKLSVNKESLYLLLLFVYSFWEILSSSLLYFYTTHQILKAMLIFVLSAMLVIKDVYRGKYMLYTSLLLVVISAAAFLNDKSSLFLAALLIVNGTNIDFRKIVKVSFLSSLSSVFCVFSASLAGVVRNRIFHREHGTARCFGFLYYSTYPYVIMFCMIYHMYLRKKLSWLEIAGWFVVNSIVYKMSTLRLSYYLSIIVLVLYIIMVKFELIDITKKSIRRLSVMIFPTAFLSTIFCALKYNFGSAFWRKLDEITSTRISLSNEGFHRYNVKLFGQYIETFTMKNGIVLPNYFYIDSGYIYSILGYGLLFSVIVTALYSMMFNYSCVKNNKVLFIWCTAVSMFSVLNNVWASIGINCILLLSMTVIKYYLIDGQKDNDTKLTHILNGIFGEAYNI